MSKKRVLLDIDNVLGDFHQAAADAMTELFGRTMTQEDLPCWEVTEKLTDPSEKRRIWALMRGRGFCSKIPVISGAQEAVAELQGLADVYFVTSPFQGSVGWVHERTNWMRKHFKVGIERIAFVRSKHIVGGELLLDDSADNLKSWSAEHPTKHAVIWDRHYNRDEPFKRATSWKDVIDLVRSL